MHTVLRSCKVERLNGRSTWGGQCSQLSGANVLTINDTNTPELVHEQTPTGRQKCADEGKVGKSLGGSYPVAVAGDHHHHHHNHNHFYHLYAGYLQLYMCNKSRFYGI